MHETGLTPGQAKILERLLRRGFRFVTFERYARHIAVEKDCFVALLDPAGGRLQVFSQVGYLIGDGIGMLVERPDGRAFVCHNQSVPATDELLARYEEFKGQLSELLNAPT